MSLGVRRIGSLVAFCLLFAACNGASGSEVAEPSPDIASETPTVEQAPSATPTPPTPEAAEPSDADKIDAALAALDSSPLPADLVAYDLLDARLRGTTGVVDLEVCGWTGDTVFDDVYLLAYRTTVEDDGTAGATLESATTTPGDCTNTDLIESALQATRDYDNYWLTVLADPASFEPAEATQVLATEFAELVAPAVTAWSEQGLTYDNSYLDGALPESSEEEVLVRSYELEGFEIIELIACRSVPNNFGLYSGELLVDDFKGDEAQGEQAVNRYQLTPRDGELRVLGVDELVWANCSAFADSWFDGVNRVFADPVPWERIPA